VDENKSQQSWDPERYERNAGFVADLGAGVMDLLAPKAGERILDLGCGHGKLTQILADMGAKVIAVDASTEQVQATCAMGLDARVMDATKLTFDHQFDAVFSNAVLHWIKDADAAIAGVKRALVAGGRFVGEMGGYGNVARVGLGVERALQKRGLAIADYWPWYFPTPDDYAARLQAAGFTVRHIELFERPTPLPGEVGGWLETFGESFINAVAENDRKALLDEVREDLAPDLRDADGNWTVDYVRLRFQAVLDEPVEKS
jgi:SAM-dependent methyltransferase